MATEFERLVIGALNVILAQAVGGATAKEEAWQYYQDWLERSRKLLDENIMPPRSGGHGPG